MPETRRRMKNQAWTRLAIGALALGGLSTSVLITDAGAATHSAKTLTISTGSNASVGTYLVSGNRTVYTLAKASKTACKTACLKVWPMVLLPKGVKHASAGSGVSAKKLGTVKRHGRLQVTYGGKALYTFSFDTAAGQVNGNVTDTWGKWAAVVLTKPAASTTPAIVPTTTAPATTTAPRSSTTTTRPVTPLPSPTTTPPTSPPTTQPPVTTTPTTQAPPPTTTTTSPGGGGVGF